MGTWIPYEILPRTDFVSTLEDRPVLTVGVAGTGFVARYFVRELIKRPEYRLGKILTRRHIDHCGEFPYADVLVNTVDDMIDGCDIVFECTGDPIYAADIVRAAFQAARPVVTLNAEFHVTAGTYFVDQGTLSEAEGDQPGSQAALHEEVLELGFRPLVYGNMKGFLNTTPTPEEMAYWSARQGTSIPMTTAFTDGTKIQFEQALVANGLGATFAVPGMLGIESDDVQSVAEQLALIAKGNGTPISDYMLSRKLTHGVFIVGEHDDAQRDALRYFKAGDGPFYTVTKPNIYVHLEVFKTIRRVAFGNSILLNNSMLPRIGVAAVAKRDLKAGTRIERGIGSFDVRGVGIDIAGNPGHLPIGLLSSGRLTRRVEAGATLTLDDVDIPESLAFDAWRKIEQRVLGQCEAGRATARVSPAS